MRVLRLVVMTVLAVVLARRDRRSLSRGENALIRAMVWVAALAVPLTATNFRSQFEFAPIASPSASGCATSIRGGAP